MLDIRSMSTLRSYLADTGETQSAFARRAGLSKQHVSLLVTGQRRPQAVAQAKIVKATAGAVWKFPRRRKQLSAKALQGNGRAK